MQDHRDENQLTLPLFSDQALNNDSDYHQNDLQAVSGSGNSMTNLSSSQIPPSKKDDSVQARHRFPTDTVEGQNESHHIPVEKKHLKVPTIFNIPEPKVRSFLNPLFALLVVATLATTISFRHYQDAKTDADYKSVTGVLSYIGSNLAAHPIIDIKLQDDNTCPQDYESVLLGVWPGTAHGCYCPDSLKIGKCQSSERPHCHDLAPRGPVDISNWGGSKWCILRAKPQSQYMQEVDCPKGFIKCSPGICVLEALDCPVTKVDLKNGSIVKERVKGELPVIGLTINLNGTPYPLVNQREKGGSKDDLNEKLSFVLDHQKQKKLFEENDFPKRVLSLPEFTNASEKTDVILSYRKRVNVTENVACLNIETELLEKSSDVISEFERVVSNISFAAEIMQWFSIVLALLVVIALRPLYTSWGFLLKGEGSSYWRFWPGLIGFAQCIMLGTMFKVVVDSKGEMIKMQEYLSKIVETGCFLDHQEVQNAMIDYSTVVDEETGTRFKYSLLLLLLTSFSLIVSWCLLYNTFRKRTHPYRRREMWKNASSTGKRWDFGGQKPY